MTKARVTSKGQITIPKEIRDRLGLRPGDEVEFVEDAEGMRIQKEVAESPFKPYRGYLKKLRGCDPDQLLEELRGR